VTAKLGHLRRRGEGIFKHTQTDTLTEGLTDTQTDRLLQPGRRIGRITGRQSDWQVQ